MAIFSLEGKGLKLTTAEDVEPHIKALRDMDNVEEVHLQGNTLGIEACRVIGEVLETKKSIKVCLTIESLALDCTANHKTHNLDRKLC